MHVIYNALTNVPMKKYLLRKALIAVIMIVPAVSYQGCKKQPKCGCGKDVLFSLSEEPLEFSSLIYNSEGTNAYFQSGMSTYYFCNPSEIYAKYKKFGAGDQLLITGDVFWECNYLYQASNYSYGYGAYYKVYNIQVKDLTAYLYGK